MLDDLYCNIISALQHAQNDMINSVGLRTTQAKHIPGWNDLVKDLHERARSAFLTWRTDGSPRFGPIFFHMKQTRAHFKLALRDCRRNE